MPFKAGSIRLAHGDALSEAFDTIIDHCLKQVMANARSIAASSNPRRLETGARTAGLNRESLHQMRIGLRRLKVAIALFSAPVPCPPALEKETAWLAAELGRLRDWDVLLGNTLPGLRQLFPDEAGLPALCEHAAELAARYTQTLATTLAGARYTGFLHLLEEWRGNWRAAMADIEQQGKISKKPEAARQGKVRLSLSRFAEHALRRAHEKLQRRSKHQADARQRHRIRIAAKKMRYTVEFFESLYSDSKVRSYAKVLAQLQETLGQLNDAAVANGLLRQLALDTATATALPQTMQLVAAASFARGALAGASPARLVQLRKHLRQFAHAAAPFER